MSTMSKVAEVYECAHYTGVNGPEVAAALGASLVSDTGTELIINMDGYECRIAVGARLIVLRTADGRIPRNTPAEAEFAARYWTVPTLVTAKGVAAVGESATDQVRDIDVQISPALPDAGFVPVVALWGPPSVVAGHGLVGDPVVVDVDTVRVSVSSLAGSQAGASVRVWATALV